MMTFVRGRRDLFWGLLVGLGLVLGPLSATANPVADPAVVPAVDPVGETADFQLDRDPDRTTSLIRSGSITSEVTAELPESEGQRVFEVTLGYDFVVQWVGRKQGSCALPVFEEFFTLEFMEQMREGEVYQTPFFKAVHQGFGDAENLDGNAYENCDRLLLFDVDQSICEGSVSDLNGETVAAKMEDLEIEVYVHESAPVLGAVKVDISGTQQGVDFKAGGDYIAQ